MLFSVVNVHINSTLFVVGKKQFYIWDKDKVAKVWLWAIFYVCIYMYRERERVYMIGAARVLRTSIITSCPTVFSDCCLVRSPHGSIWDSSNSISISFLQIKIFLFFLLSKNFCKMLIGVWYLWGHSFKFRV